MAHITPDGTRVVLTCEDLGPGKGPFSIEFPNGDWVEFKLGGAGDTLVKAGDVIMEATDASMIDGLDGQVIFLNAAEKTVTDYAPDGSYYKGSIKPCEEEV